ncbi:MAG TPA: hypothetical protein VNZ66_01420 [Aeromicrobium sp.]|nr:hypothetical protein [Aeromicrobium sp.]
MSVIVGRAVAVTGALLVLTACASGSSEPEPTSTPAAGAQPSTAPTEKAEKQTAEVPFADFDGTPAPEVLSSFRCFQDDKTWTAAGDLVNSGKDLASFQVTVQVGPADGTAQAARTTRLEQIAAGGSVAFEITKIPVQGDGPCHVQVLRLDD